LVAKEKVHLTKLAKLIEISDESSSSSDTEEMSEEIIQMEAVIVPLVEE